jgi:Ca2+-binding EF-hand superfamily protein
VSSLEPAAGDDKDTGMMGHGMMRHCMRQCMAEDGRMGEGWGREDMMRHGGMMGPAAMRIIFALMDSDGDGTISLQEFQAAHERIFKAMDSDKDGTLTPQEMHDFMRGGGRSAPQH